MCVHNWKETGRKHTHVERNKHPELSKIATYLKCSVCKQNGFKYLPRQVIYTWDLNATTP